MERLSKKEVKFDFIIPLFLPPALNFFASLPETVRTYWPVFKLLRVTKFSKIIR